MRIRLNLLRKTRNFARYAEVNDKGQTIFDFKADSGTISEIYIRKSAFDGEPPPAIWLTIEAAP